jgi:outer membrane protein
MRDLNNNTNYRKSPLGGFRGLIIGTMLLVTTFLSAQQKWTLQQCVDTAWANNRNIKQQVLTKKTREIYYQQARQNLLPNLNAQANQSWNFGRSLTVNNTYQNTNSTQTSFGISSGLMLFDGLKMKYNIDAKKADMMSSDADLEKMKMDIATYVAGGFLQILQNKELLQIANDQLELTKTKIEKQKGLIAAGKLAEGEILDLIAQQSKEEMTRLQAENTYKLSLLDLAQMLELDHFEDLELVVPDSISDLEMQILSPDDVFKRALTHRPEIKGAEYKLKSSEIGVLTAKSDFYPTLSLGAQYGTGYYNLSNLPNNTSFGQQLNDNMSAGISLNLQIPIFNKFDVRNRVRTAQIGVESNKLNMENSKLELKKTIQQAYYNAISAKSRWEAAQKSEIASREAYRFTNQKYEAGRATVYELYQSKSTLTQVLSEGVQAKYEYIFRVKLLEYLK